MVLRAQSAPALRRPSGRPRHSAPHQQRGRRGSRSTEGSACSDRLPMGGSGELGVTPILAAELTAATP